MPDCADPFNRYQVLVEDVNNDRNKYKYFIEGDNSNSECNESKEDVTNISVT